MRETLMDIANGISGKTVIHPSHIKIVQSLNVVPYEEYVDASNIIKAATGKIGVMKSDFANKMNEIKPHLYWAEKIMLKSRLYGVLHEEFTNIDLIKKEVYISHS
jgi:citrate lyase beta subunit